MGGVVAAQEYECSKCQGTAHIKMVKTANFVSHWSVKSVSGRGFLAVSLFSEGTPLGEMGSWLPTLG